MDGDILDSIKELFLLLQKEPNIYIVISALSNFVIGIATAITLIFRYNTVLLLYGLYSVMFVNWLYTHKGITHGYEIHFVAEELWTFNYIGVAAATLLIVNLWQRDN